MVVSTISESNYPTNFYPQNMLEALCFIPLMMGLGMGIGLGLGLGIGLGLGLGIGLGLLLLGLSIHLLSDIKQGVLSTFLLHLIVFFEKLGVSYFTPRAVGWVCHHVHLVPSVDK